MRIISKFKDYYDAVQAFGHADFPLFVRNKRTWKRYGYHRADEVRTSSFEELVEPPQQPELVSQELLAVHSRAKSQFSNFDGRDCKVRCVLIWFSGKVYPLVHLEVYGDFVPGAYRRSLTEHWCYAFDDFVNVVPAEVPKKTLEALSRFFAESSRETKYWNETAFALKVPCASFSTSCITINPCLKDYKFFKVLDSFQAAQELEMFLSNMANPDEPPVTVPDKFRVAAHGFDHYSFKKRPAA